jgi:hypothetical protein
MNQMSSQEELEELLPAAALEILDAEDRDRVLAHARELAECARVLAEYRGVTAAIALGLPSQPLEPGRSGRLRQRLLARAGRNPGTGTAPARSRWSGADRWAGWAVAAGLSGVLLVHHGFHRPLAYGWVVAGISTVALVGFGVYAVLQRRRVSALEERLAQLEGIDIDEPLR